MDKIQKMIYDYYSISSKLKKNDVYALSSYEDKTSSEVIEEILKYGKINFTFTLKKYVPIGKTNWEYSDNLSDIKEIWLDLLPADHLILLMSEKMKNLISGNLSRNENISWHSVDVHANEERRLYYIIKFNHELDILNHEKTQYVKNTNIIMSPIFSFIKISRFSIFHAPSINFKIPRIIYVNGELKKKMSFEKLSGIHFNRIYNIWS